MKLMVKITTTSILLSTLLMTGCGGSSSTTTDVATPKIELSKEEILKKEIRSDGATYQSSCYSEDKKEIILAGTKDGKTTIYKFDASSLDLIEKFSFDIDGVLDIKSEIDGKYTITAEGESDAKNFTFDSVSGELVKTDSQIKDAKTLIEDSLPEGSALVDFVYTPKKQGAVVSIKDEGGISLYLYGLKNPQNPLKEYMIASTDTNNMIQDIKMWDDGKLSYSLLKQTDEFEIMYDYFNKVELSNYEVLGKNKYVDIENKIKNYYQSVTTFPVVVELKGKITDNLYLIRYYKDRDLTQFGGYYIFDISDMSQKKILTSWKYGSVPMGGTGRGHYDGKSIKPSAGLIVDRKEHTLIYSVLNMEQGSYLNTPEIRYYDYETNEVTKTIPAVKITPPDNSVFLREPFYSPDKKFIFAIGYQDEHMTKVIQKYDNKGNFIQNVYEYRMPEFKDNKSFGTWRNTMFRNIEFLGNNKIRFDKSDKEHQEGKKHIPRKTTTVTVDYEKAKILKISDIRYSVGTRDDGFNYERKYQLLKNQENFIGFSSPGIVIFNIDGHKIETVYRNTGGSLDDLEIVDENTITFSQGVSWGVENKITYNYKTMEVISSEKILH